MSNTLCGLVGVKLPDTQRRGEEGGVHCFAIEHDRTHKAITKAASFLLIPTTNLKTVRRPNFHPPKMLPTVWVNNPRLQGGVLTTNKKALVRGLHTLLPEKISDIIQIKNNRREREQNKIKSKWKNRTLD